MTEMSPSPRLSDDAEEIKTPHAADVIYRRWRRGYIFAMSFFCLTLATAITLKGIDTEVAKIFVRGLVEVLVYLVICYIGAGVLDRSQILSRIGRGFETRRYERTETMQDTPRGYQRRIVEEMPPPHSSPYRRRPDAGAYGPPPPPHQQDER